MVTLIISLIVALIITIMVFVIIYLVKKKESTQFKLDFAEKELHQMYENIKAYENKQYKLEKIKVKYENLKREINDYSGKSLADIANEL